MRTDVSPPGRAMSFPEWSAAIVAGVRAFLPDARAVRKGARVVVIRHGDREARLEAGGSFWIMFPSGEMKTTMASLVDDSPRLVHGVESGALAGYFDSRFTR
jgi:hypothetical protein